MRLAFVLLAVALAALFLVFPAIDIWSSGLFWDAAGGFYLTEVWWPRMLYVWTPRLVALLAAAGVLVLLHNLVRRRTAGPLNSLRVLYLLVALALGPGLVVNVVFKDHWGRARPRTVQQFGGDRAFTPAFVISDQCERNCSFVAGHASVGFLLAGVAFAVRRRRKAWLAAGLSLGALLGFGRMVQGAHFLSDVVFAGVFVVAICYCLARYVFRFAGLPEQAP
jgi:lipid A 4'-phosphatase